MHEFPKPPGRRVRSPWLWVVAGALAAAVIGTSALHFATASCAAALTRLAGPGQPSPLGSVTRGQAYFYDPGQGPGACSFGPLPASGLYVSLAESQYARGAACGSYIAVTGPSGTVTAEVVDACPGCTNGGIDLSEAAFAKVASPAQGTAEVSYVQARDPKLPGPLALRVERPATSGWLGLQVLNTGNPLASVDVAPWNSPPGTRWHRLALSPDYSPVVPSSSSLTASACPACRAVSLIRCSSIQRRSVPSSLVDRSPSEAIARTASSVAWPRFS
jgi:expansin